MNNLHISMAEFHHSSRIIKETKTIEATGRFQTIHIAALYSNNKPLTEEIHKNVILNRFKLGTKKLSTGLVTQVIKYVELYRKLHAFYKHQDIKVINIHHLALLPIGYRLKKKFKAKLVYDAHELETETNGLSKSRIRKLLAKVVERLFIYQCDEIIVVSESIADFYQKKYRITKPFVVYNAPLYKPYTSSENHFRQRFGILTGTPIFLYQGGLEVGRGLEFILDYFSKTNKDIVLVIMGYGKLTSLVEEYTQKYSKIYFHEAVEPKVVLEYTASADYGLSLGENVCLSYYYSMPNKLFEYMMVGKPVIVSSLIEMATFTKNEKVGVVMEEFTHDSFNKAIEEICGMDYELVKHNCFNVSKKYSWEIQELKIHELYERILK